MTGESPAVEALRHAIESFLDQSQLKYSALDDGWIRLLFGEIGSLSAVWLLPQAWEPDYTIVHVESIVRSGVRTGPELDVYLSDENSKTLFGKLVVDEATGEVRFTQPLLGNFLNRTELEKAIGIAGATANTYGSVLAERFGGTSPA